MPLNIATLSLITAVQTAVLAVMLWAGTQGDPGRPLTSLRMRAVALALEAVGWGALAANAYLTPSQLLLGANAINLLAQGLAVIALRMLLGEALRWRLVLAVGVIGWLGVAWFGLVDPDYRDRVLWGSLAIMVNLVLSIEALLAGGRQRFSRARTALLLICAMAMLLLVWRNGQLWLGQHQPDQINVPNATNFFYVMLSGLQPLFASIGFLLLYSEILHRELHLQARVDPLTGVSNRLAIDETITRLLAQAARQRQTLGVLMLDADHFKNVNDRFGHAGGDKVLRALVASIRSSLRESDLIGRVGGEEFVVLLPHSDMAAALALGERIRLMVETMPLLIDGQMLQLTVSVGVALAAATERDGAAVLQRADTGLYAAKRAGRNRVMATDSNGTLQSA